MNLRLACDECGSQPCVCYSEECREPTRVLAARYGVNRSTIQRIRKGELWNS